MKIAVEEKIILETKHCEKNFDCLKMDKHIYCGVESCINNEVHLIKCIDNLDCSYKMSFGNAFICNCPTRKEIFNKYKI